jgi:hypothetical protein
VADGALAMDAGWEDRTVGARMGEGEWNVLLEKTQCAYDAALAA